MLGAIRLNVSQSLRVAGLAILVATSPCVGAEEDKPSVKRADRGPDVVLRETEERTIYEYRQLGRLTMIKVVPKAGKPYYLVPVDRSEHHGDLERSDRLIAQWVIKEF